MYSISTSAILVIEFIIFKFIKAWFHFKLKVNFFKVILIEKQFCLIKIIIY